MKLSKFDIVLIGAFVVIALSCLANFYLISHGLGEFGSGFWSFVTIVCTGEIVTFSLYRISKQGGLKTTGKGLFNNNKIIEMDEEESNEGKINES